MLNYILLAVVVCVLFFGFACLLIVLQQYFISQSSDDELKATRKHLLELQQHGFMRDGQDILISLDIVNQELRDRGL